MLLRLKLEVCRLMIMMDALGSGNYISLPFSMHAVPLSP